MKYTIQILLLAFIYFIIACTKSDEKTNEYINKNTRIPDGLYHILGSYIDSTEIKNGGYIIKYEHDFLDGVSDDEPNYFEIDTSNFVKLELSKEPEGIVQPDERINLLLTLTNEAKEQLTNFTGKYINEHVTIVIDDKAVSMHKIKSQITGGMLQITRCTDNACEYLYNELQSNVKK